MHKVVLSACAAILIALVATTVWRPHAGVADFTFINGPEVNSLDPHVISWKHDIRISNALFEGLMAFVVSPPADGERMGRLGLAQGVAERVETSADGLVYTFHLREGARWSNGEAVTAEHFRWSWQRVMTPLTGADYVGLMFVIRGARDYYDALRAAEPASFDDVGVKVVDLRTLEVTLAAPCAFFLELTAFPTYFPVYPPLLGGHPQTEGGVAAQNGIALYDASRWTLPEHLICNGPFILRSHWYKREMVLQRNDTYWDRSNVALQRVVSLAIDDDNAALHAYESGSCDLITSLPPAAARALTATRQADRREDFYRTTSYGTYYYRFNCQPTAAGRPNPLADPRVRRALAMAVTKQDIVDVTGGQQPVAESFIPPGLTVTDRSGAPAPYRSAPGLPQDAAAARKLLAEAGYPKGQGFGDVRLMYNTGYGHEPVAQRLASIWQTELGLTVVLLPKDTNAFGEALKKPDGKIWHIGRSGWFGDYRDPSTFLDMFVTGDGNNDCGYSNADFDAFMRAAATEPDQSKRMELFARAEKLAVIDEAAIVPLYHYVEYYMIRPHVRGAWPNQMGYTLLKQISVER